MMDLSRRLFAEWFGTMMLVATVVGSGIMAERHSGGNVALALLGNTIATGAILVVLISILGPVSGAHFTPAVSFAFALRRTIVPRVAVLYVVWQIIGGLCVTALAHLMFEEPIFQISVNLRSGPSQYASEFIATFGLLAVIFGGIRFAQTAIPWLVGLYITAGYWFTASTSFANPAVTIARTFTESFRALLLLTCRSSSLHSCLVRQWPA